MPGVVSKAEGSVVLEIRLEDGKVFRRHKDHVRPWSAESAESETMSSSIIDSSVTLSSETADVTNESVIGYQTLPRKCSLSLLNLTTPQLWPGRN